MAQLIKAIMKKEKNITIKTGTIEGFMKNAARVMRAADQGKPIKPSHSITFVDPLEMARFKSLIPNRKTVRAMKAARRGELIVVGDIDKLLDSLK